MKIMKMAIKEIANRLFPNHDGLYGNVGVYVVDDFINDSGVAKVFAHLRSVRFLETGCIHEEDTSDQPSRTPVVVVVPIHNEKTVRYGEYGCHWHTLSGVTGAIFGSEYMPAALLGRTATRRVNVPNPYDPEKERIPQELTLDSNLHATIVVVLV